MGNCFKCHRDEGEVRLFDVIYGNEMAKMCERCAIIEDIPIIKRPTTSQLKEAEKNYSVYQRLKRMSGLEKKEEKQDNVLSRLQELDTHPELEMPEKSSLNLVHNFHWWIMRARRNKGLSQRQLAWALGESEAAIKMIEKGELPGEPEILVKKLEQFFQIKLREKTEKEIEAEKQKFMESSFLRRRALEEENQRNLEKEKLESEKSADEPEIIGEEDIVSSVAYGKDVSVNSSDKTENSESAELQEEFIPEVDKEEKKARELREKIADEMKSRVLEKRTEERKEFLGRRELLKKSGDVPSISELVALKKEKERMKLLERDKKSS